MRRFSLFEFLSYGEDFWNDAEGVPSGRPTCPTCNTDGLEKEERMDERQDVWRCKNCKNRISDADFKKTTGTKTADRNKYWTLEFNEDQFGGIFDLLTFAERIGFFDTIEASGFADKMFNQLDLVYSNGPDENGMYVVNINGDEWEIFREIYDHIQYIRDENPEFFMAMMDQNDDLAFEDIMSAESVFVNTMPEASSEANLEDIPTMERNPDGSMPMGNCPQCGVNAVDPSVRQCENCGWDQDNACPECFSDNSVYLEEDGTKHCNNCGWGEQSLPPAPQSALGPSTPAAKAMAAGNCPKCGQPTVEHELDSNVMKCPSCGWEDKKPPALSESAKQVGDLQKQFELPSVEHPLGPHTGNNDDVFIIHLDKTPAHQIHITSLQNDQYEIDEGYSYLSGEFAIIGWKDDLNGLAVAKAHTDGRIFADSIYLIPREYIEDNENRETEVDALNEQFNMPDANHPLGPYTGAGAMDNQYYVIPIDLNGNEPLAVSALWEWGHNYNLIPENLMEEDVLSTDDQGNVVFSLNGQSYKQMLDLCRTFVEFANRDAKSLLRSMMLLNIVKDSIDIDYATNPKAFTSHVVQFAQDINNFIIKFSSTPPSPSSQANLENAFNAPSVEHPLGPHTGSSPTWYSGIAYYCENCDYTFEKENELNFDPSQGCPFCQGPLQVATGIENYYPEEDLDQRFASNQELYTSGNFVKGPDGRWLVVINPSGGQREPEPGDWATIQQRSKSFNRPVPLTLVEDLGGAWKFKNGHHPSIESQVEDETL